MQNSIQEVSYYRAVTLGTDIYKPSAASDPGFNYNINPHISSNSQITSLVKNKFILPYWSFRSGCTIPEGLNCLSLALEHQVLSRVRIYRQYNLIGRQTPVSPVQT